jgi:hypothetical protein
LSRPSIAAKIPRRLAAAPRESRPEQVGLEELEELGDEPLVQAEILAVASAALYRLGDHDKAEPFLVEAVEIDEKASPGVGWTLRCLFRRCPARVASDRGWHSLAASAIMRGHLSTHV